jgi:hypothetical protein
MNITLALTRTIVRICNTFESGNLPAHKAVKEYIQDTKKQKIIPVTIAKVNSFSPPR